MLNHIRMTSDTSVLCTIALPMSQVYSIIIFVKNLCLNGNQRCIFGFHHGFNFKYR